MSHLANTLTQIRNSAAIGKRECEVPYSTFAESLLKALKDAGYVGDTTVTEEGSRRTLHLTLLPGKIRKIASVSKPGRRVYVGYREMPTSLNGFGSFIVSTPKGIMTGEAAKAAKIGGEIICEIA